MSKEKNAPALQPATQGKYYQEDFRNVRPLDLAGGNVRDDYPEIPELAENILQSGTIDGVSWGELVGDAKPEEWVRLFGGDNKKFAGKLLKGGINMPLVGYRKEVAGQMLFFTLAGHRRTKACEMIFNTYGIIVIVPCVPKDVRGMSEFQILAFMLNENQNRVGLDLVEQAKVAKRMHDLGTPVGEIALQFNKKGRYNFIKKLLKLNDAPEKVKQMVKDKTISMPAVMQLLNSSEDEQHLLANLDKVISESNAAPVAQGSKPRKLRIKSTDVTKPVGNIDSCIELKLFFKKHGTTLPKFKDEHEAATFTTLALIFKNQITAKDLDNQFFPTV